MATIKDIAERTGLGLATISSYLNGGHVRDKNRIKIEEAVRELHFEVNETARNLKTNRTRTIGAIIPELDSIFCGQVLSEIEDILRKHGYAMIVCDCRTDKDREKEAVDFLLRRRVDGMFNIPVDESGSHLKKFQKSGKPIVLIDRMTDMLSCDTVCVNNREALASAVDLAVKAGHRRIGMIAGPREITAARERLRGYREGLERNGISLSDSYVFQGNDTVESGVGGVEELVRRNPDITAIVVSNYRMSMGAVIGLNELGLTMPDQISLVGFDNPEFARACCPKLTIICQPVKKIGEMAAEIMLKRLQEDDSPLQHIWLDTHIVAGNSIKDLNRRKPGRAEASENV